MALLLIYVYVQRVETRCYHIGRAYGSSRKWLITDYYLNLMLTLLHKSNTHTKHHRTLFFYRKGIDHLDSTVRVMV